MRLGLAPPGAQLEYAVVPLRSVRVRVIPTWRRAGGHCDALSDGGGLGWTKARTAADRGLSLTLRPQSARSRAKNTEKKSCQRFETTT